MQPKCQRQSHESEEKNDTVQDSSNTLLEVFLLTHISAESLVYFNHEHIKKGQNMQGQILCISISIQEQMAKLIHVLDNNVSDVMVILFVC